MASEPVVAREVAEEDFARMCRARRIETDPDDMEPSDFEVFSHRKKVVMKAIMRGLLTVNEAGDPTYTPPVPGARPLTFHKLTGAAFIAQDGTSGPMGTMNSMITESTRTNKGEVSKLEAQDFQFCSELIHLFLGR